MWTVWAAKSMGQADVKGSIEPGKFADMTVLSDDIFTMPKEGLKDVKSSRPSWAARRFTRRSNLKYIKGAAGAGAARARQAQNSRRLPRPAILAAAAVIPK